MDINKVWDEMTFEEQAKILTGDADMKTYGVERLGVNACKMADGPHGIRTDKEKNCTHFPNNCNLASSWSVEAARMMGRALADDCIEHGISMLLGPGINIKRHILCGRNFEYFSEDPVLAGELAAGYIEGMQEKGVSACLKHYAANNQEEDRVTINVEVDERTLRELYLKGFEIAVKKANPDSVMCSYNKINSIWASENKELLKNILKKEWGYDGMVISDWGAVHNISRCINAGLDMQMPANKNIEEELKKGMEEGLVTIDDIKDAGLRMLKFLDRKPVEKINYDRDKQHKIAREISAEGMVLLKNDNDVLPLTEEKYKKIAVFGEYATKPLVGGQGSAEVVQKEEYTDSPLEELQKLMPNTEFHYIEGYKKDEFTSGMSWLKIAGYLEEIGDFDVAVCFLGSMLSEDTEKYDRLNAKVNQNFTRFILEIKNRGKKVVAVLQNGGALVLDAATKKADAILEMWLGGEAAGGAVSDVLCGVVNPSGKLPETFPTKIRTDLDFPGNGMVVEYKEKLDVGYRYYDKHPEEIVYPFGHGLSYTSFEYKDICVSEDLKKVECTIKNIGGKDGKEIVQLYIGDPVSTVVKPIKELKKFQKVFLKAGEEKKIVFELEDEDFSYYNVMLHEWVVENGRYDIYIGASSRDIRLSKSIVFNKKMPYTTDAVGEDMIG